MNFSQHAPLSRNRRMIVSAIRSSATVLALAAGQTAAAQTTATESAATATALTADSTATPPAIDTKNVLNEIVVTAVRRREESVQGVPIAITAINAAGLERNQIIGVEDLARIAPNVVINKQLLAADQVNIYIRGFGNGANDPAIDPPIALYVDGIYQPLSMGTRLDLFSVEGVEVDRGPQGTLLGKNAPTGAISITSLRPTNKLGGAVEASYARFDAVSLKGRINLPVIPDVLAVNASVSYDDGGSYIHNLFDGGKLGGSHAVAVRAGILFTPSTNFSWLVQLNGQKTRNPQAGVRDLGYFGRDGLFQGPTASCAVFGHCTPSRPFTTSTGYNDAPTGSDRQISSQMTWHTTPVTFTSVTGYKRYQQTNRADVDGQPEPILSAIQPFRYKQFSEEFRISSAKGGGLTFGDRLDWVIGGFYSNFDYDQSQVLTIFGSDLASDQKGRTKSYALFGHAVFDVTDEWNVTVGARKSWDHKTHRYNNVGDPTLYIDTPLNFSNFSFEAGTQYKFASDKQVYFRFAEGYRAGGYQGLPPVSGQQAPYRPETVKTYEFGAKADFFDHHIRANISVFQSDYSDLQRTIVRSLPQAPFFGQFIQNAANARVRGVELEATFVPTDSFTISTNVGFLDPQYKGYVAALLPGVVTDNDNFPFPFASRWNVKVAPQYRTELPGGIKTTVSADATYSSPYYTAEIPYPIARVRELMLVNASLRFEDPSSRYSLTVYGHNLTNRHYLAVATTTPTPAGGTALFALGVDALPITYGVTIGAKF